MWDIGTKDISSLSSPRRLLSILADTCHSNTVPPPSVSASVLISNRCLSYGRKIPGDSVDSRIPAEAPEP